MSKALRAAYIGLTVIAGTAVVGAVVLCWATIIVQSL
jgi:hypothetical protein